MDMRHQAAASAAALCVALCARAAIEPVAPADGSVVATLPVAQRAVLAICSQEARGASLAAGGYPGTDSGSWRSAAPLVLRWRATAGETGPWKIRLATDPDMRDGVDFWLLRRDAVQERGSEPPVYAYEVPRPNLELGRTYWWRVWGNVKCAKWACGSAMGPGGCACGLTGPAPGSPVSSFTAGAEPPRWIALEGRVGNVRDLGGWKTGDGRRVRQGLMFRGEALNDTSVNGEVEGRSKLMQEDAAYMTEVLGIRTDLDLRRETEVAGMSASPLGPGVKFVRRTSPAYKAAFEADGMKAMGENFRVFCDEANLPVYFHCVGGADRTGTLAYVLNGVLGVAPDDLDRDWESTFYPELPRVEKARTGVDAMETDWRNSGIVRAGIMKYGGEGTPFSERAALYLMDCGVSRAEIDRFRSLALE